MTITPALTNRLHLICLVFALFLNNLSTSRAQTQTYSLLWKISGKGLKKPSYLFGSMHVKSRKAFNFSDSVMRSIDKTSAFVLELHPDSMLMNLYDENRTAKFKTNLSSEQKEILSKKYQEKYGLEPEEDILNNPLFVSDLMKPNVEQQDDMPTFLDAYLYGIARTQGKKVFGLEKTEDQMEGFLNDPEKVNVLFDSDEKESKAEFDKLLDIYIKGNLKEIKDYIGLQPYETLEKRNKVMLRSILELLKNETVFACVGVAHLPGDSGLIALLKKEGYEVTLEPASFTGISKKYNIDPKKITWHNYETKEYKILFPSTPVTARKTLDLKMIYLPDLMSGLSFGVVSAYSPQNAENISLDSVAQFIVNKGNINLINKRNFIKDGLKIVEIETEKNGRKSISRILYLHNHFYTLMVENLKDDTGLDYVKLFFDSFSAKTLTNSKWIAQKYDAGAFTIKTPIEPQLQEVNTTDPNTNKQVKVSMYIAPDYSRNLNYIFRHNDFPKGYYMSDKNAVFEAMISQATQKGQAVGEATKIFKDGYEGRAIDVIISNMYMEFRVYFRGNRQYMFVRQNMAGTEKPADDEFFDSFEFLPYQKNNAVPFTVKNITNIWPEKPEAPQETDDTEEDKTTHFINTTHTYQHTNKNTGGLYILEYSEFSKYYRNATVDSVYALFSKQLYNNLKDLAEKDFSIGAITGKEFVGLDTLSGNTRKARIWLQDQHLILQQLISTKDEVESSAGKVFFNETKTTGRQFNFNLKDSKADLIIKDLKSIDTTTQKYARGALEFYNFDKEELAIVYQGLKHSYADDTTSTGVKGLLIDNIKHLKDKNAIPILKTLYNDVKNGDELRAKTLADIPVIDSTQYDWYFTELKKANLNLENYWRLFKPLSDSLTYVATKFESFLELFDKKDYRKITLDIVFDMLETDSTSSYKDLISKHSKSITKHALTDLGDDIALLNADEYPTTAYQYLNLLPKLDRGLTDQFTKKIIALNSTDYLKTRAVEVRVKAKLPVSSALLTQQLDSLYSRYSIMLAYNEIGELNKIPAKYKEPNEFGRLLLHGYASEDYEVKNLALVGEVEFENEIYFVYSFEIDGEEEKTKLLGIAGAFQKNSKKLDFEKHYGYSNFEKIETDWQKQARALIEQLKEK